MRISGKGRKRNHEYVYSPMTGIHTDFSTLIKRFIDTGSVRYEKFAEIWRDCKMPLIFSGRQTDAEVREFTENCIDIAKSFIFGVSEFQMTVGGLYLLYAIYFKQLFEPKVKIRVTLDEWVEIQNMLNAASKEFHFDVEYIFWKLRQSNAFHFVACPTIQSGVQPSATDNIQDMAARSKSLWSGQDPLLQDQGVITELTSSDTVDQLKAIHEQYERVKCALAGPDAQQPQPSLSMIDSNIVDSITKMIKEFESWKKNKINKTVGRNYSQVADMTSESEEHSESEETSAARNPQTKNMGHIRAAIKAKAMAFSSAPSKSRHQGVISLLCSVNESQTSTSYEGSKMPESEVCTETDSAVNRPQTDVASSQDSNLLSMPDFTGIEETKKIKRDVSVRQKSCNPSKRKTSEKSAEFGKRSKKSPT